MKLALDVDTRPERPCKRPRRTSASSASVDPSSIEDVPFAKLSDLPQGPADGSRAVHWAADDLEALRVQGMRHFNINFAAELVDAIKAGFAIRTDYSGAGGGEEATKHIVKAVEQHGGFTATDVVAQRAGDLLPQCRQILTNHAGCCKPRCVHGNMLDRLPTKLLARLRRLHARHLRLASSRVASGQTKKKAFQEQGRTFMRQAVKFMFAVDTVKEEQVVAPCEVHGRSCPVLPKLSPSFKGLVASIAGVNCYDWSSMGSMKRWLGEGGFPFLCWARERVIASGSEHFALVECVSNFDHELMQEIFAEVFSLTLLHFSPTMMGDASERNRKYMVLLAKRTMRWHPAVVANPQAAFEKIFGRDRVIDCASRLRAPAAEVESYIQSLAQRRGLPAARRTKRQWTCFQVLSPALKAQVKAHEDAYKKSDEYVPGQPALFNLAQRPDYLKTVGGVVPALLRTSVLWSSHHRRLVLPCEYFEIQGYNVYDADSTQCDFLHILRALSDRKVRQLAGNAMHLRAVGTAIMFILACTQRA